MRLLFPALLAAASCFAATSVPSLPAWFEPAGEGRFIARGMGGHLRLETTGATLSLPGASNEVRMVVLGADNGAVPEGLDRLPGVTNVFTGKDRANWRTGIAQFARVQYRSIYPNIDLVYYAQGRELEYDFMLGAGADPARIRLRFEGARSVKVARDGGLLLALDTHLVRQAPPVIYQEAGPGAARRIVKGRYRVLGDEVSFAVGAYDRSRPLVIDPVLTYVSYYGGEKVDQVRAIAASRQGGIWIAGATNSEIEMPGGQPQPFKANLQGNRDAFLARVIPSPTGQAEIVNYTYLGGAADDEATAIAVDAADRVYLTGYTFSGDYPRSDNAPVAEYKANEDSFITILDPSREDTEALIFSSYFGGDGRDFGTVLALRPNGNVLLAGNTTSGELPGADSNTLQMSNRGGIDAFIAEFNPTSGTLVYATFLGGDGTDNPTGLAVAANGQVIVSGMTSSTDFPVAGFPYGGAYFGKGDVFVSVLDTSKTTFGALIYGGYFGGNDLDYPTAMAQDADGTLWIAGYTFSRDLPASPNAIQTISAGSADLFLMRIDLNKFFGAQVVYCTYFGGSGADVATSMVLEGGSRVTLGGYTMGRDFPLVGDALPLPATRTSIDAFVVSLDTSVAFVNGIVYSGLVSSPGTDVIVGLARDAEAQLYFAGYTNSSALPVSGGAKPNKAGLITGFTGMIQP